MRSSRALLLGGAAAFLLLAPIVAGLLILRGLDITSYRPQIIAQVEVATGRTFEIGKELTLGFEKGIVIRANDLALGNAEWGSEPNMLSVKEAELRLALVPLLKGEVRIERLVFKAFDILLETDQSGRSNWHFDGATGKGGHAMNVDSFAIESGSMTWRSAGAPKAQQAYLSDVSLEAQDDGTSLVLTGGASIFGHPFELTGHMTSPSSWDNHQSLDLGLELSTEAGDIRVEGAVQRTAQGVMPALKLTTSELNVAMLAQMVGHDISPFPALSVTLELARMNDAWKIEALSAKAGESDLSGSARLETAEGKPMLTGSLSANMLELGELVWAKKASPGAETRERQMFSPTPLDLMFLNGLNLDLTLHANQLSMPKQRFKDAQLEASLIDGQLKLDADGASVTGKGRLRGSLVLDAGRSVPSWSVSLALTQYPASALQRAAALTVIEAPVDLKLDLRARGASPREMAQSLSGKARIVAGRGRAHLKTIDNVVGGLSTVVGQLFEQGANDTQLNCLLGDFEVEKGIATTQVAMIDSAAATLRADGRVDFGNERLDLTVTPRPKKPTLTVAVPVHVQGALDNPRFEPDRTSSLAKLIGVGSLLLYPPAAIVALGDLGDTNNACAKLIDSRRAEKSGMHSSMQRVATGIGDAASAIGSGFKRLFRDQ